MNPHIRFCRSFDGTRLAYTVRGRGPALLCAPHWFAHSEHEYENPVWRPWIESLSHGYTLVRADQRSSGLSDWDAKEVTLEALLDDLGAVADAAGLKRFALFGFSQGGAVAVAYAARYPERVTHLVLLGAYARGWFRRDPPPAVLEELEARIKLVELGLDRDDPAYRLMFISQYIPSAPLEHQRAMTDIARRWASPRNATRLIRFHFGVDVRDAATKVRCPALLFHAKRDLRVPFEEGCILSSLIPGSRLVALDSANHILLQHEPAFSQLVDGLRAFVPGLKQPSAARLFSTLTARETQILERVARGLGNAEIASQLHMAEKTVRNNITRIFSKLEVETRAQAIVLARDGGLGGEGRS